MSTNQRQNPAEPLEVRSELQQPADALRMKSGRLNAMERYSATPVRCHLIADSYPALNPEFSSLISAAGSIDVFDAKVLDSSATTILVLPVGENDLNPSENSANRVLEKYNRARQATASLQVPLVLVCDNPTSLRRMGYPANTLAAITNSPDGACRLRRIINQFGQRRHQRIWIVGDDGASLSGLFSCHGFDTRQIDCVTEIESVDVGVTSRNSAEHILLLSCGPKCYSDYENFPPHFVSALQSNDLLSMNVVLDETSADMKPAWEERGAATMMLSDVDQQALIDQTSRKLYLQHQIAILHHDAVRNSVTGIYNRTYLDDCGRRLHSMASRGSLFFAVAVIQFRSNEAGQIDFDGNVLSRVSSYISQHLREHDVVAQRFPGELVFLITNSTPPALHSFLQRLSDHLHEALSETLQLDVDLAIGATAENGVSFDAMLHRATMAALQCKIPGSRILLTL